MLIGHLPEAYLFARTVVTKRTKRTVFSGILVGGVFPDLDMIWFHTFGEHAAHHHDYITHRPLVYFVLLVLVVMIRGFKGRKLTFVMALALGALLHLVLDSVAGEIAWSWPISHATFPLTTVQATHSHWVLSFMNHWYFQLEVALTLAAITVFFWSRRKTP